MTTPAYPNHQNLRPAYVQATDPGAVQAGVFWVDTSPGTPPFKLYVRNLTNTGWDLISIGSPIGPPGFYEEGEEGTPGPPGPLSPCCSSSLSASLVPIFIEGEEGEEGQNGINIKGDIGPEGPTGPPGSAGAARGYIDGYTLSNNATGNELDVSPGECRDSTNVANLILNSAITDKVLQTSGAWSAGSAGNGLDTGAGAANTWYHCFAILKDSDDSVDLLFSLSPTAPTMPAGYTYFRRIGSLRSDGSSNWRAFYQRGDEFHWSSISADFSVVNQSTTPINRVMLVPTGIQVMVVLTKILAGNASANVRVGVYSTFDADEGGAAIDTIRVIVAGQNNNIGPLIIGPTNTSAELRTVSTAASTTLAGSTRGWIDQRGKNS